MKPVLRRVRNPHQSIGKRGGKAYVVRGRGGFFSSLARSAKNVGKTLGKTILKTARNVAPSVAKTLAPELLTYGAAKLGEYATNKGAPDSLVNLGSQAAQLAARKIQNIETPKLDPTQKMVSDFVANKSQNLLQSILSQGKDPNMGNGVRNFGGQIPNNVLSNQNLRQPYNNGYGMSIKGTANKGLGVRNLGRGNGAGVRNLGRGAGPNVFDAPRLVPEPGTY